MGESIAGADGNREFLLCLRKEGSREN
jgi:hypothetical protein